MNINKKSIINATLLIIFFSVLYSSITPKVSKGFMWQASKDGKSIYLIGTLHPAKSSISYENKKLNKIISNTNALAVETDITNETLMSNLNKYIDKKTYLEKGEIKDLLSKSEQEKLNNILNEFNVDYNDIKKLTPYGLSNLFSDLCLSKCDKDGISTDLYLINKYKSTNKEVTSIEDPIKTDDLMSSNINDLKQLINSFDNKKSTLNECENHYNNVVKSYINGDDKYFIETEKNYAETPSNKQRNLLMANEIDKLLDGNKKYAVAVGVYHFFGKYSILNYLKDQGYEITKL